MIQITEITPNNVRDFAEGNYNYYVGNNPKHYLEQYLYRAYLCSDCLEDGKCKACGCTTPQMFFAPRKVDKLDKWPPFFRNEEDWEEYKTRYKEAFTVTEAINQSVNTSTGPGMLNIQQLIADAKILLDSHREQDAENPPLTLEQAKEILQSQGRLAGISTEHT